MKREARLVLKECRLSIENTSTKQNKYVGNQKLSILLISISKNCLVESVFFFFVFFLQNKRHLYLHRPFFSVKHCWTNSFNLSFSFEWGMM